jgi:A/G-specific adenine glycosylase
VSFNQKQFAKVLSAWFQTAQRDLPWRHEANAHDPYRVLVSEVMLQQTTVTAVIPFYNRFLERFPDTQSLAAADLEEVLPLWAGLGYYSRARNLHACASAVMEKHGGIFPTTLKEVLALPGIGRYTAGAVLSIALDQKVPIVDANVARVLSRVLCI